MPHGNNLAAIAVILVIAGIYVRVARRDILWGVVLIIVGLVVGPGGVSIFGPSPYPAPLAMRCLHDHLLAPGSCSPQRLRTPAARRKR
ncbi:hypothetical protein ETD83_08125 [Actinomadura soli]|uniref:Uncharacterized protein n=1 Tax=Actinomadura soli TaxID=2508997 RepID=A0A5C4JG57_9ACTN|nr:GPGG-motif small membrane protein [Actinomadura soli]TMR04741.1 hypothetical protein ETD83_08125 [Actinomadura soli]